MPLISTIRFVSRTALFVFAATFAFISLFATLQPYWEPATPQGDIILVLGGGMSNTGVLHRSTTVRVDRGVTLFKTGSAPKIHFTGGVGLPDGPTAGQQMAKRAALAGIRADAISFEGKSQSTLQNALFSKPAFDGADHIILVTEGFHLPRSWLSFKVFGAKKITLIHARRFRGSFASGLKMVVRETIALWFNAARLGVWALSPVWEENPERRNAILY